MNPVEVPSTDPIAQLVFWLAIALVSVFSLLLLWLVVGLLNRVSRRHRLIDEIQEEVQTVEIDGDAKEAKVILAETVIRRIDNLDDLKSSLIKSKSSQKIVRQLSALREDLIDLLKQNQVESFRLIDGMELDAATRQLVRVMETVDAPGKKTVVSSTVRSGFRYVGAEPPQIVRKTDIVLAEAKTG